MTANEIRGGLQHDPFDTKVWKADSSDEWVVEWHTPEGPDTVPEQAAMATFREVEGGIEWNRFWVREPFRNQGIYTTALRWSLSLGVDITGTEVEDIETWRGFKQNKDRTIKIDKRSAKARTKVK